MTKYIIICVIPCLPRNLLMLITSSELRQPSVTTGKKGNVAFTLADEHPTEAGKNYWQDFLGTSR